MMELLLGVLCVSIHSTTPACASTTNEIKRSVLSDDVQMALTVLHEETMMPSTDIFRQVLLYMSFAWAETACEWIESIDGVLGDKWLSREGDVEEDVLCFWCGDDCERDVEEQLYSWRDDDCDSLPWALELQMQELTFGRGADGHVDRSKMNRQLAVLKYTAWKVNGIVWDEHLAHKIGYQNDTDLMDAMLNKLRALYISTLQNQQDEFELDPDLCDSFEIIDLHLVPIIDVFSSLFSTILGVRDIAIALTIAVRVETDWNLNHSIGVNWSTTEYAIDGHGSGTIYETTFDHSILAMLALFKDITVLEGFCVAADVGADSPVLSLDLSASMAEGLDGVWRPIGVEFATSFDETSSGWIRRPDWLTSTIRAMDSTHC